MAARAGLCDCAWLADITSIASGEAWLYRAAVFDVTRRKIIGWAMHEHMQSALPLCALVRRQWNLDASGNLVEPTALR
jgi:transposase InsO family protein